MLFHIKFAFIRATAFIYKWQKVAYKYKHVNIWHAVGGKKKTKTIEVGVQSKIKVWEKKYEKYEKEKYLRWKKQKQK